jgi:hypothetical protein
VINIKKDGLGGECSMYGGDGQTYRVFVGKPEGKRIFAIYSSRWKANVNRDLKVIE